MWGTVFAGGAPYIENIPASVDGVELGSKVTKEIDAFFYARSPLGAETGAPQFWRMRPQKNLVSPQAPVNKYVLATDDGLDVLVYADTTSSFNVTAPTGVTSYMYRWFTPSRLTFSSWQPGSTWQFATESPVVLQLDAAAMLGMGGIGDYNGDGTLDIAWRRRYDANALPRPPMNSAWLMQPGSWTSTPSIAANVGLVDAQANNPDPRSTPSRDISWVIVGTPDWDHDGTPDVLWRNVLTGTDYLWYMTPAAWQGGPVVDTAVLPAKSDIHQQLVGSADFDGDGQVDLLWRHRISGANLIEYMTGTTVASSIALPTSGRDWEAQAIGDFNLDGVPDIVWRHRFTHDVYFWHLARNGTVAAGGYVQLPTPLDSLGQIISDPRWQIAGVGYVSPDGITDLLWHNRATGQNIVWKMSGTTYVRGVVAPSAW